jgi:hypothetical protein
MTRLIAVLAILVGLNAVAAAQEKTTAAAEKPARCTSEQSGFRAQNGINVYYVEVTSACARRQLCIINAYVVGSRGGKTGQGTLVLGKVSPGQESRKTWAMRTAENGGMASMSWSCKDI